MKLNLYCYYTFPNDLTKNEICLVPNQTEKCNYTPNLGRFDNIQKWRSLSAWNYLISIN